MKNLSKPFFILIFTIFVGLIFRIWNLDKPEGLWNDEYMAWYISSFDFGPKLFQKIFFNCHMPLYYLFLKFWAFCFGNSDLALRFSSVFIGLLNIVSMYFLGKTFKDKKTGLLCALISALSGFLIYFSQEIRLYGLIFLISVWLAYFFIQCQRNLNKKNFIAFICCNFLLLITHTIGFVFIFFNLVIFSVLIAKKYPEYTKKILLSYGVLILLFLPLVPFLVTILTRDSLSQNWGIFNFSKICFVLIDYLSPIQTNITNSAVSLAAYFSTQSLFSVISTIFLIITGIAFATLGIIKNKNLIPLLLASAGYFAILIAAGALGKLILSTKYSVEIYPVLILLVAAGTSELGKKAGKIIISLYFAVILFLLCFSPQAPQKLTRPEGHKTPVILLNKSNITENDYIIALYHQFFRYEKYANYQPKHLIEIDKGSIGNYLLCPTCGELDIKHGKQKLRHLFLFDSDEKETKNFENIFTNIPSGKRIALIIPLQTSFFSSNDLKRIASSDSEYANVQIMFMAFSYAKIKLINSAFKYCNFNSIEEKDNWIVLTFTKK